MRIVLFADTNLFLQCRDIKSLPWNTISEGKNVVIMITGPVMQEIDRLKNDGNARRARKARGANTLLQEILAADKRCLALSGFKTTVDITFAPNYSKADLEKAGEWLDIAKPDNELVATALVYRKSNIEDEVCLLTNDTLPMLTANRCSLPYKQIPEDWRLPPEPDDRDKRIKELEQKIAKLEHQQPMFDVFSTVDSQAWGHEHSFTLLRISEANEEDISNIVTLLKHKNPMITEFPRGETDLPSSERNLAKLLGPSGGFATYLPASDEAIKKYQQEEYPKWLSDLRNWILKAQHDLMEAHRYVPVKFDISNIGDAPLVNAVVEFFAYGGVLFSPSDVAEIEEMLRVPNIPKPPDPPHGEWQDISSSLARLASFCSNLPTQSALAGLQNWPSIPPTLSSRRDRHAFYWKGGMPRKKGTSLVFECEEFRHKVEPESFTMHLYFPPDCGTEVSVICRVTGSNLISPCNKVSTLKLVYQDQKAVEALHKNINETL